MGLEKAKNLTQAYIKEEFGYDETLNNLREIGLAYTTHEDTGQDIQVDADLINYKISIYLDGELYETRQYDNIEDMIETELTKLNFDDLVGIG